MSEIDNCKCPEGYTLYCWIPNMVKICIKDYDETPVGDEETLTFSYYEV